MLRIAAAAVFLMGLGAVGYGLAWPAGAYATMTPLAGFVALTLSLILAIVGTPAIRDLVR
jgi:hypothetical protein